MSHARRKALVQPDHPRLSIARQCKLVSITRSTYYYQPSGESDLNLELMRLIDKQYLETPFYGPRQMTRHLRREGYAVSRTRIGRLMKLMGLVPRFAPQVHNGDDFYLFVGVAKQNAERKSSGQALPDLCFNGGC